jgi:hypothetical protein
MPRRLITLAATLADDHPLGDHGGVPAPFPRKAAPAAPAAMVVVLRGGMGALRQGLSLVSPLVGDAMPCWVWWNGSLDEAPECRRPWHPFHGA